MTRSVTNASPQDYQPEPARGSDGDRVPVFLLNATRTSDGPGPGVKHLPRAEAGALVTARMAIPGTEPPHGWSGS
jgi:hypothetical protein